MTLYSLPYKNTNLRGDGIGNNPHQVICLHGGAADRFRFLPLRNILNEHGLSSFTFDFIGHGETGGSINDSSLRDRVEQTLTVIQSVPITTPLNLIASSLGGYIALKVTELIPVSKLILIAPAIYAESAYQVPFGNKFSEIIRQPQSWQNTDAWQIIEKFTGAIHIYTAEHDTVVVPEITNQLFASSKNATKKSLYCVPGSKHSLLQWLNDNPDELRYVAEEMAGYLDGVK